MRIPCLFLLLFIVTSCKPKKATEVDLASAQTDSLEETVDSVNASQQDGTVTAVGPPEDSKQQLPPELEVLLDQTHGLWRLSPIEENEIGLDTQDLQGPYFLQADLTNDKRVDYVVQIAEETTVKVYAFIGPKSESQKWQEKVLASKSLQTVNGTSYSPFILTLLEERKTTGQDFKGQTNGEKGILIKEGAVTTLHQWKNGAWTKTILP